jgi:hypothetical protein
MAYPNVLRPYGLRPINLIGGQGFAGSTRSLPIQYGFATDIFYGDFVVLSRGFITRASVAAGTGVNQVSGVFLGCSFTDPVTRQKRFSQFWPAGTLAGDAEAVVCDDPDTIFKAVVCSAGVAIASAAKALVGTNLSMINNAGNVNTGNSANAVLAPTATPASTILPVRCIGLVDETAYSIPAVGSSSATTITLTTALPQAVPVGAHVAYVAANGQVIDTGSFVATAAAVGALSVTMNAAIAVPGGVVAIPAASTIVFTVYPEVLVKTNLLVHGYYSSATA